jgi:hypothetical protein
MDINLLKEDLIEFVMEKAYESYHDDPPRQMESWIREFFDQLEQ